VREDGYSSQGTSLVGDKKEKKGTKVINGVNNGLRGATGRSVVVREGGLLSSG